MNQRAIPFFLFTISLMFNITWAQNMCILVPEGNEQPDTESTAAFMFLNNVEHFQTTQLSTSEIRNSEQLSQFQLIWFHHNDTSFQKMSRKATKALKLYVEQGGKLILSLEGARAVNDLNLDKSNIEVRNKKAEDSGYGRKLGMHAFRSHPVFDGLFGGSYIFKPHRDTTLRIIGFFENNIPQNGKVIAVDWDYIFLREKTKLLLEYHVGQGKVLVIGAYTCLSQPNINHQNLRKFLFNCLNYILGGESLEKERYWSYDPQQVILDSAFQPEPLKLKSNKWPEPKDEGLLRRSSENQFWDVAGERILVMGHENGGIDEIWAHPFMALKDYDVQIRIGNDLIKLADQKPVIEVRPASFRRIYHSDNFKLVETIVADRNEAASVIHYTFKGPDDSEITIQFSSNLRIMWPYSETVLKKLHSTFDPNLNAFYFSAENNEFNVLVGSNVKPVQKKLFIPSDKINGEPPPFETSGTFRFKINNNSELDVIIAADHQAYDSCLSTYKKLISSTSDFYKSNTQNDPYTDKLQIISPDPVFNEGYAWAVRATDRVITHTPGVGTSLVAGIGSTQKGWDGGHKVNGRPGYAWYFGRDGQWSGFALLNYGDFDAVKKVLQMYQDYQDLNGKIFHEISTSGIVHFDASDATPLYIVLAGRYLKQSGDIDFIRESWFHINKALAFCFSTDTDGDHLIENTNVGHGWVEGGKLFGSHSSLYLSACWAEALEAASYMAAALENQVLAEQWKKESALVAGKINNEFWNTETNFLNQGKFIDGSYHTEQTILPSIPVYFNLVESAKAKPMLTQWSADTYSSDWGCRIVSKQSKSFNPRGYHSGSVWPLYTGWVALAEYSSGRSVQGFTHIMNNLLVYQNWALGFVEEVLNGEVYEPAGVCHHQCWSETMVIQPTIEGLLGLKPDAVHHFVELSPQLPANWDSLQVKNIRVGQHLIHLKMIRNGNNIIYTLEHTGPSSIRVLFDPQFEPGTKVKSTFASGVFENVRLSSFVPVEFYLDGKVDIQYKVEGGIQMIAPVYNPALGDSSTGIRVIDEHFANNIYTLELQGKPGSAHQFDVFVRNPKNIAVEGGKITAKNGPVYTIETTFAGEGEVHADKTIGIHLSDK